MFGITSLRVWFKFLRFLGGNITVELKASKYYQYLVLKNLAENGVFEYFKEPHTYENFIEYFQVIDDSYSRELMNTLFKHGILIKENDNEFRLNLQSKDHALKYLMKYKPEEIPNKAPGTIMPPELADDLNYVFEEYATGIFSRLQGNFYEFAGGVQLFNWDSTLSRAMYQMSRDSALLMAKAHKLKNGRVLDLGCANGYGTADIWRRLHPKGNEIHAIDRTNELLDIARNEFGQWLEQQGYPGPYDDPFPTFYRMDAEDLSFPDNHFDLIIVNYVFHWLKDQQKGIDEITRVLKSGGKICGSQPALEVHSSQWLDYVLRTVKGVEGMPPEMKFRKFFTDKGFHISRRTLFGFFCAVKPR
ncbi:MAG: class I SAM-dependent methyltransferase [Candidatus Hermodarchaeota archaeon]